MFLSLLDIVSPYLTAKNTNSDNKFLLWGFFNSDVKGIMSMRFLLASLCPAFLRYLKQIIGFQRAADGRHYMLSIFDGIGVCSKSTSFMSWRWNPTSDLLTIKDPRRWCRLPICPSAKTSSFEVQILLPIRRTAYTPSPVFINYTKINIQKQ